MRRICQVSVNGIPCEKPAVDFIEITYTDSPVIDEQHRLFDVQSWMCAKHFDQWMQSSHLRKFEVP